VTSQEPNWPYTGHIQPKPSHYMAWFSVFCYLLPQVPHPRAPLNRSPQSLQISFLPPLPHHLHLNTTPTHTFVSQNRAPRLGFQILAQITPPRARLNPHLLAPEPGVPCPKQVPPTALYAPLRFVRENRAPTARFSTFGPNHPFFTHGSIPTFQLLNPGVSLPKCVPTMQLKHPPRCVGQNRATAARFLVLPSNPPTLAHQLIPMSQPLKPYLTHLK
jgi:hypothetical protein